MRIRGLVRTHEIGHTPYGAPSDPGAEGGPNGNGFCAHMALHAQDHQNTCNEIEDLIANGAIPPATAPDIADLCDFSGEQAKGLNGRMEANPECPTAQAGGQFSKCPGC